MTQNNAIAHDQDWIDSETELRFRFTPSPGLTGWEVSVGVPPGHPLNEPDLLVVLERYGKYAQSVPRYGGPVGFNSNFLDPQSGTMWLSYYAATVRMVLPDG